MKNYFCTIIFVIILQGNVAKVTPPNLSKNVKLGLNKIPSIKEMEPKEEILKCIKLPGQYFILVYFLNVYNIRHFATDMYF